MDKKCIKCNRIFTSVYLLEKHVNRKISCDIILSCTKCSKIFNTNAELLSHSNKKVSCVIPDKIPDKILDKIKLLNIKSKLENDRDLNRSKLERERVEQKNQGIREKDLARQELQNKKHQDKLAIEEAKNIRKQMTVQLVNDKVAYEKQLAINEKIKNDKIEYRKLYDKAMDAVPDNLYSFSSDNQMMIYYMYQRDNEPETPIEMFHRINSSEEYITEVLEAVLKSKNAGCKSVFYNDKIDLYAIIRRNSRTKEISIIQMNFVQILDTLHPLLNHCYKVCTGTEMNLHNYKYDNQNNKEISEKFTKFNIEYNVYLRAIGYEENSYTRIPKKPLVIMPANSEDEVNMTIDINTDKKSESTVMLLKTLEHTIKRNIL